MYQDTIAAISTPLGQSGIGIVRLSGDNALAIAARIFTGRLSNRLMVYGHIVNQETGERVDEVLAVYMKAPYTYTCEDIVEIDCHGGPVALQRILQLALASGARLANPGEFTLRAFLNGRIDLAQAESVLGIIEARTDAGLRLAMRGLSGELSGKVKAIRSGLLDLLAYVTARIDFPEDDVPKQDVEGPLESARHSLEELIATADAGIIYRHGIRTAIIGRPNVGKSSLLNRLLRKDRAIVTPVPGTTRDTLEETVNLGGIPFLLIDTAGIIDSRDRVEVLAVDRSKKCIDEADFVLLVLDSSEPLADSDKYLVELLAGREVLVAANKSDLPQEARLDDLPWPTVQTSALTGAGLPELERAVINKVLKGEVTSSDALLVTSPRHKEVLLRAQDHLQHVRQAINDKLPEDFLALDLTCAVNALGEITGDSVTDDLLATIFSRFCIGK